MTQTRGHLENGEIRHFQVTLKVGFRLDETPWRSRPPRAATTSSPPHRAIRPGDESRKETPWPPHPLSTGTRSGARWVGSPPASR
ncbi:dodecin family protein [Pseudonocardia saturnea]